MQLRLLIMLSLFALSLPAAEDPFARDPASAAEALRQLQYAGRGDEVLRYLAPAAPDFVDRKSNAATRENIQRMADGVYGFEVVEGKADGDAGCVLMLAAWLDGSGPKVELFPFYMWRHEGAWRYLPNPLAVETWYQSVPDELEPAYARLETWYREAASRHAARTQADPAVLIGSWRQEGR